MADTVLEVKGMNCLHCKATVEEAVKKLEGVVTAEADLEKKVVRVTHDESKAAVAEIRRSIEDAGYTVT